MKTKELNIQGLGFDTSLEKFKESELFSKHEDEISSMRIACDENLTYKHSYTIKSCRPDELHALWDKDGRLASLEISIHIDVEKTSEIDYLLGKLTDEYGDYDLQQLIIVKMLVVLICISMDGASSMLCRKKMVAY